MESKNIFPKYLGKAKHLCVRLVRIALPPLDVFYINYAARKMGNIVVKAEPVSFDNYCNDTGSKMTIIENEQDRIVYEPAYFGKTESKEHVFKSKPVYIAELRNAIVLGGTGLVLSNDKVLTDICANDTDNRVKYVSGAIRRANKKCFYMEVNPDIENIDAAINLCGLAATNYYHLTFEILSRYGYVKDYLDDGSIPVLIDAGIQKYPQFVELVKYIIGERQVVYVPEYKRIHCNKLIQTSMNTWMPMNVRKKNDFRISDNLIAKSAVDNIREATTNYRLEKGNKKIFISRKNASLSRVINEAEVAELFKQNGFEIICTEDLSYKEQVELFSSASCIVGASGAALTNLVYCKPGAVFGCIIPMKYEFCIYSSIAHMVGCSVLFLDAKIARYAVAISAEQCRVDIVECQKYINELSNLI